MKSLDELREKIKLIEIERDLLIKECLSYSGLDTTSFIEKSAPQSELFMVEIIPIIHELFFSFPQNKEISVLDVGPQTFSGTALLSRLHRQNTFNNLKMKISAIDIHDKFRLLGELFCPEVEFITGNIFDITERKWDLIICSHVIEHVTNPLMFLRQLQKLSKQFVVVACPWHEDPIVTTGHQNTIDKKFVRQSGALNLKIFTNFMWGKTREVCIFTLPSLSDNI